MLLTRHNVGKRQVDDGDYLEPIEQSRRDSHRPTACRQFSLYLTAGCRGTGNP